MHRKLFTKHFSIRKKTSIASKHFVKCIVRNNSKIKKIIALRNSSVHSVWCSSSYNNVWRSFILCFFLVFVGYSPHPNYGMITQSDYTGSNYGSYGSIAAYQSGNSALGGPIAGGTTNSSIANSVNPYGSSVIGSSNGYSNVLSISSGGIPSVSSCYHPIPSSQHLQTDKNCTKDR